MNTSHRRTASIAPNCFFDAPCVVFNLMRGIKMQDSSQKFASEIKLCIHPNASQEIIVVTPGPCQTGGVGVLSQGLLNEYLFPVNTCLNIRASGLNYPVLVTGEQIKWHDPRHIKGHFVKARSSFS